jgi:uncharacterized protein
MNKVVLRMVGAAAALLIAIAAAAAPAGAQAVDAERMTLAKTYLDVSQQTVTTKQLADIVAQALIKLNPDLTDRSQASFQIFIPRFDPYMVTMIDDMARVYAGRFTAPELKAIIEFYKTPTGQKFAKDGPTASVEVNQIGARWGARIGEDMRDAISKDLAAQGQTLKLQAPKQ